MGKPEERKLSKAEQLYALQEVIAPDERVKHEIKRLQAERRRLEEFVCSKAWFDAVWYDREDYGPNCPCYCHRCNGKRLWPPVYVDQVKMVSYECWIEMSDKAKKKFLKKRDLINKKLDHFN